MCNLQTHMDRDHRIHEAQRLEPVYTKLAAEYGVEYQPPNPVTESQVQLAREVAAAFARAITADYR